MNPFEDVIEDKKDLELEGKSAEQDRTSSELNATGNESDFMRAVPQAKNRQSDKNKTVGIVEDPSKIQYQPECNTSNLRDFLNRYSFLLGFLTIAAPFCIFGVLIVLGFMARPTFLNLQIGEAGSIVVAALLSIIGIVMLPLILIGGVRFAKIIFQPTHLLLKPEGIFLHWQQRLSRPSSKLFAWSDLTYIDLRQLKDKTRDSEQYIIFKGWNLGKECEKRIKISSILESRGRSALLDAIRMYAGEVPRNPEVTALLEPAQDSSYTQLWLSALSAPPERESLSPLEPGSILKNTYKIVRKIAMGGQGTAYLACVGEYSCLPASKSHASAQDGEAVPQSKKATDNGVAAKTGTGPETEAPDSIPEQIVLKEYILPTQVGSRAKSQSIETLRNEAEILERLKHKNIVKFLDYFVQDHRGYLVLEHLKGKNLRDIVKERGPLTEKEILPLALQMCEMLNYLHSQSPQIIHRDFTPDNLILTNSNELKLIDFNVARQSTSTVTATVVGKHSYLSLEQFRGKASSQSDIYSLGCILHFLSTGQDPEPLTTSSPIHINNELSAEFNTIVERATELEASLRYANAGELKKDLSDKIASAGNLP